MLTPQRLALEGLIERQLTSEEVEAISPFLAVRNDVEIAKILSAGRKRIQSTPIGIGTILAVMAPNGGEFLNNLEQLSQVDPNVKWALKLIEKSDFDIGHPVTREQLEGFAVNQPSLATSISKLLSVAEQPDDIHYNIVSDALNIAEGRLTL